MDFIEKKKKRKEVFSVVVCSGGRLHSNVMAYLLDTERSKLQGALNRLFLNHSSKKKDIYMLQINVIRIFAQILHI